MKFAWDESSIYVMGPCLPFSGHENVWSWIKIGSSRGPIRAQPTYISLEKCGGEGRCPRSPFTDVFDKKLKDLTRDSTFRTRILLMTFVLRLLLQRRCFTNTICSNGLSTLRSGSSYWPFALVYSGNCEWGIATTVSNLIGSWWCNVWCDWQLIV